MKHIVLAASAAAAFALTAGAASAQTQSVTINAEVTSKCGVSAQSTTVTLGDLTDSEAKVRSGVTTEIAQGLNTARIIAFCNGVNNSVTVDRAVLARAGSTGNGVTQGGFAQFINYNLDATINSVPLDTTSTGGASIVPQRFGGHVSLSDSNTHVRFASAVSNGNAVATSGGSSATATDWNANTDRRLAAGSYAGSVTLTVAPGA